MAGPDFNPYREWLGLTAGGRPTFYSLLGLTPFESSLQAIEAAARERIERVRQQGAGLHAALAQQIVNELTAARLCLLSPAKKAEYDDALRQYVSAAQRAQASPPTAAQVRPVVMRPAPVPIVVSPTVDDVVESTDGRPEPARVWVYWLKVLLATLALTVVFMGMAWIVRGWWMRPAPVKQPPAADETFSLVKDEALLEFASLPNAEPFKPYQPLELPQTEPSATEGTAADASSTEPTISDSASYSPSSSRFTDVDVLVGHTQGVSGVAFTPDGGRIISASWDGTLRIWDFQTRQPLGALSDGESRLRCLAVNPQGTLVVTGGSDRTARLWSLVSQRSTRTYDAAQNVIRSVAFTADGNYLAWGTGGGTLSFRGADRDEELFRFGGGDGPAIAAVRFLPDRRHVVFGLGNSIRILRAGNAAKTLQLEGHEQLVTGLDLTPGGRQLISCSWDHTIRLWSLKTGQTVRWFKGHVNSVHAVVFSPDGRRALSASGGHFSAPERWVEGVDNSVRLWNVADGRELARFKGHDEPVLCVAFSPDGHWAASGSADKTVRVWRLAP